MLLYGVTPEFMQGYSQAPDFMHGASLEQLYGEEMGAGFFRRMARKTGKVVKRAAPIVATGGLSAVLPKKVGRIVGKVGLTAATGGLNLVARPSVIRKATHQVANVSRAASRSPLVMSALKAGLSAVPGGGAALQAYATGSSAFSRAKKTIGSFTPPKVAAAPSKAPAPRGGGITAKARARISQLQAQAQAQETGGAAGFVARYKTPLMIGGGVLVVGGLALALTRGSQG